MKQIICGRQALRTARRTLGCAAIVALVAACGGGESFSQEDAIDRLILDLGFTNAEATCGVEGIERELGSFDILDDPENASDEDADTIGDILLGCVETTLAVAADDKEPDPVEDSAADEGDAAEEGDEVVAAAAPGAAGDWTAAQLCTLLDGAEVSAAFGAVATATPIEQFEDPTRSICAWADPDSTEAVPPALVLADQEPSPGPLFIDGTPVEIAGASDVDFRPDWLPGEDFLVLTAGDQQLTLRYRSGAPAAFDVMVAAAADWAAMQAG